MRMLGARTWGLFWRWDPPVDLKKREATVFKRITKRREQRLWRKEVSREL